MLRLQLLLATLVIAATHGLSLVASVLLLSSFGLSTFAASLAAGVIAIGRGMELFVDPTKPHPLPLLPWMGAAWQCLALTVWFLPDHIGMGDLPPSVSELAWLLGPAMAALAIELAQRLASRLATPSIQQVIAADMAVAEWFAKRRMDVERRLLAELCTDAVADVRLTRRLEALRRRFDATFPAAP
jgi:hypothetical protein